MPPHTTVHREHHVIIGSSVRPSVRLLSVIYSGWSDFSSLSGRISIKLGINIHRVSGHCWKSFQDNGSKVKVRPGRQCEFCEQHISSWIAEDRPIWTKTYPNTWCSREINWLRFEDDGFKEKSKVKVAEMFAGGGIQMDDSLSKTILFESLWNLLLTLWHPNVWQNTVHIATWGLQNGATRVFSATAEPFLQCNCSRRLETDKIPIYAGANNGRDMMAHGRGQCTPLYSIDSASSPLLRNCKCDAWRQERRNAEQNWWSGCVTESLQMLSQFQVEIALKNVENFVLRYLRKIALI